MNVPQIPTVKPAGVMEAELNQMGYTMKSTPPVEVAELCARLRYRIERLRETKTYPACEKDLTAAIATLRSLAAEVAAANEIVLNYIRSHRLQSDQIATLTAELARLRLDGERIDWLEANSTTFQYFKTDKIINPVCTDRVLPYVAGKQETDGQGEPCSIRAAIDAARKENK